MELLLILSPGSLVTICTRALYYGVSRGLGYRLLWSVRAWGRGTVAF